MGYAKGLTMEAAERDRHSLDVAICAEHIQDPHLAEAITRRLSSALCVVCDRSGGGAGPPFAVALADVMDHVVEAIEFLFVPADTVPVDSEDWVYVTPIHYNDEVLAAVCAGAFEPSVFEKLLPAMVGALPTAQEWTAFRAPAETEHLDYGWASFVETVKHHSRFIYPGSAGESRAPGTSMLGFLDQFRVYVDGQLGLVTTLDEDTVVYRGRLVERRSDVAATASALGPAPSDRAAANRMSPAGISLLYASHDAPTAVAEIAAHGPKPRALIGGFRSTKSLQILDLTQQPQLPSVFDHQSRTAYVMARFLRGFVRAVTAPVVPDGREHVDYVPTQVVTEYLRWMPSTVLDGIALPSAQSKEPKNPAKTYVFFVGPDEVADAGVERLATPFHQLFPEPMFTLDKDDVALWDVIRTYDARPSSPWA